MFQRALMQGFVWHDNMYLIMVSKYIYHEGKLEISLSSW